MKDTAIHELRHKASVKAENCGIMAFLIALAFIGVAVKDSNWSFNWQVASTFGPALIAGLTVWYLVKRRLRR